MTSDLTMAKVLSGIASGLTIAALLRTSFEAFDILQTSRNQSSEYKKLSLRLNTEKCRLYNWGESMGLIDIMTTGQETSQCDLRFPQVVQDILEDILQLVNDAQRVQEKYRYLQAAILKSLLRQDRKRTPNTSAQGYLIPSNRSADVSQPTKVKRNIDWVIFDRNKFTTLVDEIRALIDRLADVTHPPTVMYGIDEATKLSAVDIRDTEALAIVAGACSKDNIDIEMLRRQRPLIASQRTSTVIDSESDGMASITDSKRSRYAGAKL